MNDGGVLIDLRLHVGTPHIWLEFNVDAFNGFDLKNRSTTSVSMGISNMRTKYKYDRKHIYTIMLLPPHVDLHEALAPVRRDLEALEQGIDVQVHPDHNNEVKTVRVFGAVSMLLADHVQACANSCHLGNNAKRNCRSCLMNKDQRFDFGTRFLDHDMIRSLAQRLVILSQMARQAGANPSATRQGTSRPCMAYRMHHSPLATWSILINKVFTASATLWTWA